MRHALIYLCLFLTGSLLRAESWPPLEEYIRDCVLIVKAKQVGDFTDREGAMLTFKVIESWKGHFDPKLFVTTTPDGFIQAGQGEHGVKVASGQEIVFFYTRHNQPEGRLARHNTSFPIEDGKVVYAISSVGDPSLPGTYTLEELKQMVGQIKSD